MSRPLRMGAAAAVVSASVLLSRLLALGREALLAGFFGLTPEADLYRQAFLIPDFLNYLLAGAYLTITLIPILSRHLEKGDESAASQAFTSVFRLVAMAVLGLTALMWLLADPLVDLVFPDASDPGRLASMTRLVLPAQVFLVVGALLMAVQYTHKRFVLPALAPLIYNLGIIGGGLIGAAVSEATPEAFLWGAVIGSAVGNFGLQWFGARRTGTWLTKPARGRSAVGEYLLLALPFFFTANGIAIRVKPLGIDTPAITVLPVAHPDNHAVAGRVGGHALTRHAPFNGFLPVGRVRIDLLLAIGLIGQRPVPCLLPRRADGRLGLDVSGPVFQFPVTAKAFVAG